MDIKTAMAQSDHHAEVWRVEWNITGILSILFRSFTDIVVTGSILASSGDDGNVRLWKAGLTGEWRAFSVIHGEEDDDL